MNAATTVELATQLNAVVAPAVCQPAIPTTNTAQTVTQDTYAIRPKMVAVHQWTASAAPITDTAMLTTSASSIAGKGAVVQEESAPGRRDRGRGRV